MRVRKILSRSLLAAMLLVPVAAPAQDMMPEEQPEPGFRALGPRTVVSFVRQTLPDPDTAEGPVSEPRWNTLVHMTNTGNGPIAAAAVFAPADGSQPFARRLGGIVPGQTRTVSVAAIIGDAAMAEGAITGVVFLRFFAPVNDEDGRFYSQMVTAETIFELPDLPPRILRLDVERPQVLAARERRLRR